MASSSVAAASSGPTTRSGARRGAPVAADATLVPADTLRCQYSAMMQHLQVGDNPESLSLGLPHLGKL